MIPVPSSVLLVTILLIWRKISKISNMDRNRTVAGLDIHKDSIYLCIMRHDETIIFENKYGVLTPDLRQMCNAMVERGVTEAAMESTAVYWVPVWNELCESMKLKLVNPYFIKQLPGRKSDVKDAQWIAECLLKNLIKGSFVPEPIVQDMRKPNRRIMDLNEDMTYKCNKLDAAMQRCGFRLSNYVNTIKSRSYQKVLVAIIGGTAHPDELVKMVHGRTINKHGRDTIKAAVTGTFSEIDITIFRQIKEVIDMIERQIEECQKELTALCEQHFPEQFRRLQTIPGVKERAATAIIAETGVEIAWGASRTRNCFFSYFSYIQTTVKKKSKMKIQVAIARKILVAIWHMLSKEQDFIDIYLKRLEENRKMEEQLKSLESKMV